jgi:hypothetical protein
MKILYNQVSEMIHRGDGLSIALTIMKHGEVIHVEVSHHPFDHTVHGSYD